MLWPRWFALDVMLKLISRLQTYWNSIEVTKETLIILSALYFAVVINFPINQRIFELTTEGHGFFSFTPAIVLTGLFMLIFSVLSSRFIFKPLMTLLLLTSAAAMYATLKYNVLFDYAMMENIFETHSGEAFSYINISSLAYLFVFGVLPAGFLWLVKIKPTTSIFNTFLRRVAVGFTGLILVGGLGLFFYKDYVSVGRNHHYLNKMIIPAHIFNTVKYLNNNYFTEALPYKARATGAKLVASSDTKPTLFVLVVGETARAKNMAYYGYERNTNPYTQGLELIKVNDVTSCGTATAHSLPCMMSDLNHSNYKREQANSQDNVLDVMKQAGVDVVWFENDGGDKEVAARLTKVDISTSEAQVFCDGSSCYDEMLVEKLSAFLSDKITNQTVTPLTNQMVALHIIGSHGPTYFKRYPAEMQRFTPACNRGDIENCTDEEIVNVYDNTLVYTDYVLAKTIALLEQYSKQYHVALVYLSDHGESLGENGIYLHGTPYAFAPSEQIYVPWLMWLPENYTQAKQLSRECIIKQAARAGHSHDNLFHTLLGLYGVETHLKNPLLDISHECKLS